MKRIVGAMIGMGLLLLLGCATRAPAEATLATTVDDVVGIWHKPGPTAGTEKDVYVQFGADGSLGLAFVADMLEDNPDVEGEFRFEGTRFRWKDVAAFDWGFPANWSQCVVSNLTGIYEVRLLADGRLKFAAIEDSCQVRRLVLHDTEWAPIR